MNTSRRSIFGLFGAALATGGAALTAAPAKAEPRERKFINGKLICRCDAPEYDAVSEPEMIWTPWGTTTGANSSHTHTISQPSSHSHTMTSTAGGAHTHTGTTGQQIWQTRTTNHCIYCGGIEGAGLG